LITGGRIPKAHSGAGHGIRKDFPANLYIWSAVLKGGVFFLTDLRGIFRVKFFDFIAVSSYGQKTNSRASAVDAGPGLQQSKEKRSSLLKTFWIRE